jgi:hypothetical protein
MYSSSNSCLMHTSRRSRQGKRLKFILVGAIAVAVLLTLYTNPWREQAALVLDQTGLGWKGGDALSQDAFAATTKVWTGLETAVPLGVRFGLAPQSTGTTFYVSNAGRDGNDGSQAAPWRTIMRALMRVKPGDTVIVRGGLYRENITFPRSGAEGAQITVTGYPGEKVILDGSGLSERNCFSITTQSYITIDGFIIRNYSLNNIGGWGLVVWDEANHITLRNVEIYNMGAAIKVAANGGNLVRSDYTFENITAHDYPGGGIDLGPGAVRNVTIRGVQLSGAVGGNDTGSDGIAVENGTNILIEDTIVRGHMGDGVDCKADAVTLRRVYVRDQGRNGIKVWKGNSVIESCRVEGSRAGLGLLVLPGAGSYVVRDSVFSGTAGESGKAHSYTVELGRYGAAATDAPTRVMLYGNTFHTEGNDGVLVYLSDNARLQPQSDYNTYYSPRQDSIFANARNASAAIMPLVTPVDINNGAWARFIRGETHSRFSPRMPAKPPSALTATPANAVQRPRRVAAP